VGRDDDMTPGIQGIPPLRVFVRRRRVRVVSQVTMVCNPLLHAVSRRLRLDNPSALGAHLDATWPSLESVVSIIARPVVRASQERRSCPTPVGVGRLVIRATHERWGWRAAQSELGGGIS
jgi:hypothetical protein